MASLKKISGFRPDLLSEEFVQNLLLIVSDQSERISVLEKEVKSLKAEIRLLKKLPKPPKIKASKLDEDSFDESDSKPEKSRQTGKRRKKENLEIHEKKIVKAADVPSDWHLLGYKTRIIQDFIIRANNIEYSMEIWQSPDGKERKIAELPSHLQKGHFGATLEAYILHQYYHSGVTQPLIASQLLDYGVDISTGQINNILIENKDKFHKEQSSVLTKGISICKELRTDDTGTRHLFKNGSCNCINSDLFTHFTSSYSKSRINFLEILRQDSSKYYLNQTALNYLLVESLPLKYYDLLSELCLSGSYEFEDEKALKAYFAKHSITAKYAIKKITEAVLIGCLVEQGFDPEKLIHSDGAGQFNIFIHSLCWKHAERPLLKLKAYNPIQEAQLQKKIKAFWNLYKNLKKYKQAPKVKLVKALKKDFDNLCQSIEGFHALNLVLESLRKKKDELLRVLDYPETSLHNNDSERDIREFVKRRKVSGSTRSENGKKARDTFLSLKKTCQKLGVSFWEYLIDRIKEDKNILPLSQIMQQKHDLANV